MLDRVAENRNKINISDRTIGLFLWFVFFGLGLIAALRLNIPPVLDEVGILANSAYLTGRDWSETVYTMGSYYYKYGLSVLYAPFLALIDNPYILYKALLAFNMAVYAFVPVISFIILRRHFETERTESVLISAGTGLIPSCFLYQMYAKADSMLIFLPWVVMLILLELEKTEKENIKKKAVLSVLLSFCSVYAFAVHTRGLVVIIAAFLTVFLSRLIEKKSLVNFPLYFGSTAVFLFLDKLAANAVKNGVYGFYGTQHASAESFDFEYLKKIFSREGICTSLKLMTGWLFDSFSATLGILLIAVIAAVVYIIKHKKLGKLTFTLFALLNFLGAFGMGIIFFFPVANKYYIGEMISRSDRLIYDRYMAAGYGLIVLFGIYVLTLNREVLILKLKLLCGTVYAGVFAVFFIKCAHYLEGVTGAARYFIPLCSFLKVNGGTTYDAFENITQALLYAGIFSACLFVVLLLISGLVKKEKLRTTVIMSVIFLSFGFILITCYGKIRLSRDESLYKWTNEPAEILNEIGEAAEEYPILWDGSARDIKHYQFLCKDFVVGSYCTDTKNSENCFIISKKGRFIKEYYNDDYYLFDDFDYDNAAKDIVYVKGAQLAGRLEELGYKLTKYTGKLKKADIPDDPQEFKSRATEK